RMPALLHAVEEATAPGSAAVPGRINPMTGRVPVSITQNRRPSVHRLGAGKNARAPARGGRSNGARERGRPWPHQSDDRSCTCFNHANASPDL
ncbi:MAG: hypothetical protein GX456_17110, partial [Verrucomicrobia bacterium]|nr:hypothetical protein [Verrucomicrobiota bacterium]